jgi:hypothetical protein
MTDEQLEFIFILLAISRAMQVGISWLETPSSALMAASC